GFRLEVAAPLPRGDRAQFLLEKLTELGTTAFTPLHTARSIVNPREAKLLKLERHVIEASKQCGRNVLLEVRAVQAWPEFLAAEPPDLRLVAPPSAAGLPPAGGHDVVIAVGPEGGFTDEEVNQAKAADWIAVNLGPRRLRVETAALYLTALLTRS